MFELDFDDGTQEDIVVEGDGRPSEFNLLEHFNAYAGVQGMKESEGIVTTRAAGHLIFFQPYENEEQLFALHLCDGHILPARWHPAVVGPAKSEDIAVGAKVLVADSLVPAVHDNSFGPDLVIGAVERLFSRDEEGDDTNDDELGGVMIAEISTSGGHMEIPVQVLIPL